METTYNYGGQQDLLHDTLQPPVEFAGFWLRVAATIIDGVILQIVQYIVYMSAGLSMFSGLELFSSPVYYSVLFADVLYFTIMESSNWQGTLGKRAVGLKVTDMNGEKISFGRALGRYFAKFISVITLCIGFIMAGFTEKKQALHDIIAGTLVVKS